MRLQAHAAFQHFALHATRAALHAKPRAAHAGHGDRRPDLETAHALSGGGDSGFNTAALNVDDRVGQRGAFKLAQPGQFNGPAGR